MSKNIPLESNTWIDPDNEEQTVGALIGWLSQFDPTEPVAFVRALTEYGDHSFSPAVNTDPPLDVDMDTTLIDGGEWLLPVGARKDGSGLSIALAALRSDPFFRPDA